jgi:hypothetical protein
MRWQDNIKIDLKKIGWKGVDWIHLAQDRDHWVALVNTVINPLFPKKGEKRLYKLSHCLGFEVLTAVNTKMAVFWVLAPCGLVEVYQRFRGPSCLHHHRPDGGGCKYL